MKTARLLLATAGLVVITGFSAHVVAQDPESRKQTNVTFSSPVEMPGFTLQPGTYRFEIADPDGARRTILVSSAEGKRIGVLLTVPQQRADASGDPVVTFGEMPAGTPPAVRTWFYPQERTGFEFVYPRSQAERIAKVSHRSVLSSESELNERDMHGAKVGHVNDRGEFSSDDKDRSTGSKDR